MKFELFAKSLAVLALIAGGAALAAWETRLMPAAQRTGGNPLEILLSSFGGAEAFIADGCWLRANLAWESRDERSVRRLLGLALAAEPHSAYFRVNAARMLAFDLPEWRRQSEPAAPSAVLAQWRREAADEGIALLVARAGRDPTLWIEAGNLALHARADAELAAEFYGRAALMPGAPWYVGRIYARLLQETGRPHEALAWLQRWLQTLPEDDPAAQHELVRARIAELESELSRGAEAL